MPVTLSKGGSAEDCCHSSLGGLLDKTAQSKRSGFTLLYAWFSSCALPFQKRAKFQTAHSILRMMLHFLSKSSIVSNDLLHAKSCYLADLHTLFDIHLA